MLSARTYSWITYLTDPTAPNGNPPERPLRVGKLSYTLKFCDAHGLLPGAIANIKKTAEIHGAKRILAVNNREPSADEQLERIMEAQRDKLLGRTTMVALARRRSDEVTHMMAQTGIPAVILKGADFADRLYGETFPRIFGDVDLLVPEDMLEAGEEVLQELGYLPAYPEMKHKVGYGQQSFRRLGADTGAVELHWDLVNSPSIRRGISVKFEDLQLLPVPDGRKELPLPSPGSLLLIATVHAATSHAFDRLLLLCDIAQAARGVAGEIDTDWLASAARRTGASTALSVGLSLAEKFFGEPRTAELIRKLRLPPARICKLLVTKGVVMRRHAWFDSPRRNLFREMLKKAGGLRPVYP